MYGDPSWVYWMAGIAAGLALVYMKVVLYNAEQLHKQDRRNKTTSAVNLHNDS